MGRVDAIADHYVDAWADLSPCGATSAGISGHDHRLDDLSIDGFAARDDLNRATLAELATVDPADEHERVALEAMQERLGLDRALYDAGETTSELNVVTGAVNELRMVFDLMPADSPEALSNIASRLEQLPRALTQYRATLSTAADEGHVAASQQIVAVARQCRDWASPSRDDYFRGIVSGLPANGSLRARLDDAAEAASAAVDDLAAFLEGELAARGRAKHAVGPERYALASRYFLGTEVDLEETYLWGFDELARIGDEMRAVARRVSPGAGVEEAVAVLDADPDRRIAGRSAFRDWMQALADQAIADLHPRHFDIHDELRSLECCIAPTSEGTIYYTGPSEDLSRPGRMWWAVPHGTDDFSTWREVTTVYHEGVPGHHLQVGQTRVSAQPLNRWQRLLCLVAGHGEGWGLYAERLMDDLGYLDDPGDKLGMLDAQAFRAARVVVDIGMHLELTIPAGNAFGFAPGSTWTPELGWEFMRAHCRLPDESLRFELNRYLGWPGQAPAYKVGERIWLQVREEAKARNGASFDLRQFHREALDLGPLGLDPFKAAMSRRL